jgi:hypothetical protein
MACQVAPGRLTWDDGRFLVPKQQGGRGVQPGLVDCCERDPPELRALSSLTVKRSQKVSPPVRKDERGEMNGREYDSPCRVGKSPHEFRKVATIRTLGSFVY